MHASRRVADIDIAVVVEPRKFLDQMANYADDTGRFLVERHFDPFENGRCDIINLRLRDNGAHEAAGAQLIAWRDLPSRILVEMRAERWSPNPPTREAYCKLATDCLRPLLRAFNAARGTRYRLRIERVGGRTPVATPRTTELFERFAVLANTASLHQLDWNRFYGFVRESRQLLTGPTLRKMLLAHGFSHERAADLAEIYAHLWAYKINR